MAGSGAFPKATGDIIYLADYNAIYNIVAQILGVGSGTSGYGATPSSSALTGNPVIGSTAWNNLYADINACATHQNGAAYTNAELPAISAGGVIGIADINLYKTAADNIAANKDTATQLTLVTGLKGIYNAPWKTAINATATVTFASADNARNFFNAGGRIRISAACSGGTSATADTKDYAWKQAIDSVPYNNVGSQYTAAQYRAGGQVTLFTGRLTGPSGGPNPNNYNLSSFTGIATKTSDTVITFDIIFNDGSNPPGVFSIDENVTAEIDSLLDYYKSTGAVVSPIPSALTITKNLGP